MKRVGLVGFIELKKLVLDDGAKVMAGPIGELRILCVWLDCRPHMGFGWPTH